MRASFQLGEQNSGGVGESTEEKEVVHSSATDGAESLCGEGEQGKLVRLRLENLAVWQRVSEPGSATKNQGSRSSSAPHLSGRHVIKGFVYMGPCTTGNLTVDVTCMENSCPIMLFGWRWLMLYYVGKSCNISLVFVTIFGAEQSLLWWVDAPAAAEHSNESVGLTKQSVGVFYCM